MTPLCSVLIYLVAAGTDAQPQGFAAVALASTPYYRQKEAGARFGTDRADEHFGRALEHGSALEHFERALEDENQMRRTDDRSGQMVRSDDDPRRPLVHGWEAPHGKWEHLEKVGETRWEHRAGAPHRAETSAAQIYGVQGRAPGSHAMLERAVQYAGQHGSAEAGQEGIFGALKEGFESMYTLITITDYPYFCPCSWAKGPTGERQQLTMAEGGKCISAANEPCAKQSAGRVGLLLLAAMLVGRE